MAYRRPLAETCFYTCLNWPRPTDTHKKNGIHDVGAPGHISSSSSTSTLTGQRGPIPLTIKTLEAENKRKTLLAEAAAAAAGMCIFEFWHFLTTFGQKNMPILIHV